MDYKEKYEQALSRARQFSEKPLLEDSAGIVEYIFPELAESEDERIRKEIRDFICWATDRGCITKEQLEKSNSWLAWLTSPLLSNSSNNGKNAWSEEDEVKINRIVACLENLNVADNDILLKDISWLKSLKERGQKNNNIKVIKK